jgi:hypothetical protein
MNDSEGAEGAEKSSTRFIYATGAPYMTVFSATLKTEVHAHVSFLTTKELEVKPGSLAQYLFVLVALLLRAIGFFMSEISRTY